MAPQACGICPWLSAFLTAGFCIPGGSANAIPLGSARPVSGKPAPETEALGHSVRWLESRGRLINPDKLSFVIPDKWDCETQGVDWGKWLLVRKAWCCQHRGRACPPSLRQPHDCQAEQASWMTEWSKEKKSWCCKVMGLGCADDMTTQAPEAAQNSTHRPTHPPAHAPTRAPRASAAHAPTRAPRASAAPPTNDSDSRNASAPRLEIMGSTPACAEAGVNYLPLDMPGHLFMKVAANPSECQKRCADTAGCKHFSYWTPLKTCHLQDESAERSIGGFFISGPPNCLAKVPVEESFVAKKFLEGEHTAIKVPVVFWVVGGIFCAVSFALAYRARSRLREASAVRVLIAEDVALE